MYLLLVYVVQKVDLNTMVFFKILVSIIFLPIFFTHSRAFSLSANSGGKPPVFLVHYCLMTESLES